MRTLSRHGRPTLETLGLSRNPFGDEGLAALVAPPLPAGALSPPTGGLTKLKELDLSFTKVTDAGCATLAAALDSGALPALETIYLHGSPASDAAKAVVQEALEKLKGPKSDSESEEDGEEEEEAEEEEEGDDEDEEDGEEEGEEEDGEGN